MSNPWLTCADLPPGPRAVFSALHRSCPSFEGLGRLTVEQWRDALDYCDRSRLTLVLREVAADLMPPDALQQVEDRAAKSAIRVARFEDLYRELHARLSAAGLEFVALKGLAHDGIPGRVQYDIDLFLPCRMAHAAQEELVRAGWMPLSSMESFPTDHLPALLRRTDWKWRGDYFDPDLPIAVELHHRFWSEETERLHATGVDAFWDRRIRRRIAGVEMSVLSAPDELAYAALHLLRHTLQGSVLAFHVYEIARMLEARNGNDAFWTQWRSVHSPEVRRLTSISFRLAREWFGCPAAPIEPLPPAVDAWFRACSLSPGTQAFRPNKDHLWLHIALLDSTADRLRVVRRRLLPGNLPPRAGIARVGVSAYLRHTARRVWHHGIALPRTTLSGIRLWQTSHGLGPQFWRLAASGVLFNFGLFIFFLHYNLFLLDLGFREDLVGAVNSGMRIGSMAGTIPAAVVARRLGLRSALLGTIVCTAAAECFRAVAGTRLSLVALAAVSGCVFSVWAVILAPLIAGTVGESRRAKAFSVFFACMFATGIAGNWVGGLLPHWIPDRRVLLLGSAALSAVAVLPALRLGDFPRPPSDARVYPRSRFILVFLFPFAVWHLATGAFNPFNNVYFKRLGFADARIGSVFALSQCVQIAALLLTPAIIRRLGLVGAIASMMAATAAAMAALAGAPAAWSAIGAYLAFTSFQWMSEPGLNTLLMNGVPEPERGGASALNYVVAFGAQAVAAAVGGSVVTRFGYGPMLAGAAAAALLAAGLFPLLLRSPGRTAPK